METGSPPSGTGDGCTLASIGVCNVLAGNFQKPTDSGPEKGFQGSPRSDLSGGRGELHESQHRCRTAPRFLRGFAGQGKVLTKPWTSAPKTFSLGRKDEDLLEYYCTNNQEPEQLGKLRALEAGGKR